MKRLILFFTLILAQSAWPHIVFAHEGEDHGATATTQTSMVAQGDNVLRVVSYPGTLEVFVKYPPPHLNEPVTARLFFADYATNHPVDPTAIDLSFPGTLGAKVTKQTKKISDGVYEFEAIFVRDTAHTALLRYTFGDAEQLTSLSPFYAGTSAERLLTANAGSTPKDDDSVFPTWILIPIGIGLGVLAFALFRRRRKRLQIVRSQAGATTVTQSTTHT
ncbi:MAG TPA: hypothetical protein VFH43_05630 [Candidatus Kapabacteria bacterium]|jgi:hypothetical protein|nr:hypothetical protein [Candidatus Kapabacteria bacterium]